jgi:hypothetical protein
MELVNCDIWTKPYFHRVFEHFGKLWLIRELSAWQRIT